MSSNLLSTGYIHNMEYVIESKSSHVEATIVIGKHKEQKNLQTWKQAEAWISHKANAIYGT